MFVSEAINEKTIYKRWEDYGFDKSFRKWFGGDAAVDKHKMRCLKNSLGPPHFKSGVWKLKVTVRKRTFPVILKVMKKGRPGNEIEFNLYRKAEKTLRDVIPQVYSVRTDGDYAWALTEHVRPISEQIEFHPKYFLKIVPALAKLHARTFNKWQKDLYGDWLPFYHSDTMVKERKRMMKETLRYLDEGMKQADLKAVLEPHYHRLQKIYKKGPIFFPEVIKAGLCITHNDLQMRNMGCNDVKKCEWNIKFLDWESAKFYPCWYDMVSLIGVFFGYRQDFKKDEERILRQCVRIYAREMRKNGVKFRKDPMKLYKMAYLQRVLEYDLYYHITKGLHRKEITLLPIFLDKIKRWGEELRLH